MAVRFTETCIETLNREKAEDSAFRAAVKLMFTQQAEAGTLSSEIVAAHSVALLPWAAEAVHEVGCIRRCPETDNAYRCVTAPPPAKGRAKPKPPSEADKYWELVQTEAE